jgi:acyl homoserine lactone synthase
MIIHVETYDRARYAAELGSYFRLRKRVFRDQLGWKVQVSGDMERDILDDLPCVYALSVTPEGVVNAGIRLIPTTQMTLLELAFDGLVPDKYNFKSQTIWELSHFCVDHDIAKSRLTAGLDHATLELTLANFDYARRNGITQFIVVTEERIFELTRLFNAGMEILGRQTIDDCRVVCGLFSIDAQTAKAADQMRKFLDAFEEKDAQATVWQPPFGTDATSHVQAPEGSPAGPEKPEWLTRSRRA